MIQQNNIEQQVKNKTTSAYFYTMHCRKNNIVIASIKVTFRKNIENNCVTFMNRYMANCL